MPSHSSVRARSPAVRGQPSCAVAGAHKPTGTEHVPDVSRRVSQHDACAAGKESDTGPGSDRGRPNRKPVDDDWPSIVRVTPNEVAVVELYLGHWLDGLLNGTSGKL